MPDEVVKKQQPRWIVKESGPEAVTGTWIRIDQIDYLPTQAMPKVGQILVLEKADDE